MSNLGHTYPWQQSFFKRLSNLPQALLLTGQEGIGKRDLAFALAYRDSCVADLESACGQCRSCELNVAGTHPDFFTLMPEAPGKQIKINDVRALRLFTEKTPQYGRHKLVVLGPVESLNVYAANALLKTLEEPSDNTRLVLFSHAVSQVMATIRSRCQVVSLSSPSTTDCSQWLKSYYPDTDLSQLLSLLPQAPLMAKSLLDDDSFSLFEQTLKALAPNTPKSITEVSDTLLAVDPLVLLNWWLGVVHWSIKRQHLPGFDADNTLYQQLDQWGSPNLAQIYLFMDLLIANKRLYLQGANPNKQLLLEDMLIKWYKIY